MLDQATAACVLGMHSSGTSLTAGLLGRIGVDFGPSEVAKPARRVNTKGLWEHRRMAVLNESILEAFGGAWNEPPALTIGWETSPALKDFVSAATELLDEFFGCSLLWGWKDPRNALLVPFWRRIIKVPIRYVICVRHPQDVAVSLGKRDGFSEAMVLALWRRYTRDALLSTERDDRIVCCYESFWGKTPQLSRLARFVGREEILNDPTFRESAAEWIDPDLWRNRGALDLDGLERITDDRDRALYVALLRASMAQADSEHHAELDAATNLARSVGE